MSENELYKSGVNLVCSYTAKDSADAGITGLAVQFSIYKSNTYMFFDFATGLFDSGIEILNTATPRGNGLYNYLLPNAYSADENNYRVRVVATDVVTGDVADYTIEQSLVGIMDGIRSNTRNLPHSIKKDTEIPDFKFIMLDSTTGDPTAGFAVTATRKLDSDISWSAMVGSIVDNGDGAYSIDIGADDTNGDAGVWRFTAAGAKTTLLTFLTEDT